MCISFARSFSDMCRLHNLSNAENSISEYEREGMWKEQETRRNEARAMACSVQCVYFVYEQGAADEQTNTR